MFDLGFLVLKTDIIEFSYFVKLLL